MGKLANGPCHGLSLQAVNMGKLGKLNEYNMKTSSKLPVGIATSSYSSSIVLFTSSDALVAIGKQVVTQCWK